jgi:hypothetical protein
MGKDVSEHDDPVSDKLCVARREAILERIDGLEKRITASVATATVIILIVQFILTLWKG